MEIMQLLSDPNAWISLLTLTVWLFLRGVHFGTQNFPPTID